MNNNITPPPELVQQWCQQGRNCISELDALKELATQAARWGADQQLQLDAEQINQAWQKGADDELAACVFYVGTHVSGSGARALREIRRPKPPSLKEQAIDDLATAFNKDQIDETTYDNILRALKALPDD